MQTEEEEAEVLGDVALRFASFFSICPLANEFSPPTSVSPDSFFSPTREK